jgi:hypothetical protein
VKQLFKFSRPHGIGYRINKDFFVSITASKSVLPPILALINPKGEGGAVVGKGAPLQGNDKSLLSQPLIHGAYALVTPDQKSVLRMDVVPRDRAFDDRTFEQLVRQEELNPEIVARMRGTWWVIQFRVASHHPDVAPTIAFMRRLIRRMGQLSEGVVFDPFARITALPENYVNTEPLDDRVSVFDVARVHAVPQPDASSQFHTVGLRKFTLPEIELYGVRTEGPAASHLLLALGQMLLDGLELAFGQSYGDDKTPFEVREGGLNRAYWEGVPVLELLPPTRSTSDEALANYRFEYMKGAR